MHPRRIIATPAAAIEQYHQLEQGDLICCRLRIRPGEEHILLDLAERGVIGIPSFRAQLCSRSKAFQTRLFSWAMMPLTTVIYTVHDLIETIGRYENDTIGPVIVKTEGKNGGIGIFRFASIEDVYTQSGLGVISFPYVVQPLLGTAEDLRVIIIDDYVEAYSRRNPHGFRNNLHCGGTATPRTLTAEQEQLCRRIMEQGGFPYAHLDLLVSGDGVTYFSEINLCGGLRGARIDGEAYRQRIVRIHHDCAQRRTREE